MSLMDLAHNLFGAGGGHVHPSAATAAIYAFNAVHMMEMQGLPGASDPDTYKYAFGSAMGWTRAETDAYWMTAGNDLGTEGSVDAYDTYVQWIRTYGVPSPPPPPRL